jgi:hypothetical protein
MPRRRVVGQRKILPDPKFGSELLGVTPVTSYLPMAVTPREGLEDGVIYTVDDYIKIFYKEDTLINSFDELVEFFVSCI